MSNPILSLQSVCVHYGQVQVIFDLSLTVSEGEAVAIIGSNGAGKTTTLLSISGIVPPSRGQINFYNEEITTLPTHKRIARKLGHVPEGRKIFPRLTVKENLEMGAYLRTDSAAIASDTEWIYSLFPILKERIRQPGGTLSGGEQQMLAIGRALMGRPKLLLLDEPSMGVAPLLTAKIFETLKTLNSEGLTILLVEQNAKLALSFASRAYVLENGRIVTSGTGEALLTDSKVKQAYLGQ